MSTYFSLMFISDVKSVPLVEVRSDQKMCSVYNKQDDEASVEPCSVKKAFICVSLVMPKEESMMESNTSVVRLQYTGTGEH